jgi:hypothetical protein
MTTPSIYPVRSLIRFKARSVLWEEHMNASGLTVTSTVPVKENPLGLNPPGLNPTDPTPDPCCDWEADAARIWAVDTPQPSMAIAPWDEEFFQVVATTVLHPCRNPDVYEPCPSAERAAAIEDQVSQEIIDTYHQMHQTPQPTLIERLNRLVGKEGGRGKNEEREE